MIKSKDSSTGNSECKEQVCQPVKDEDTVCIDVETL